jgi:hypothetical protein
MDNKLKERISSLEHKLSLADERMVKARTQTTQSNAPYEDAYLKRMAVKAELDKAYDEAGILYPTEVLPKKSMRII